MPEENITEVLSDLGLSNLEIKVYLALIKLNNEPVTAKAVSDITDVVRQDSYRVLSDLHTKGIVEKIHGDCLKFRSLPLQSGLSILLEQKTNALHELESRSRHALETFTISETEYNIENHDFYTTANIQLFISKFKKEITNSQSTIELIYAKEKVSIISFHLLETLELALQRGVKVSIVTTRVTGSEIESNLRALHNVDICYENLQMRIVKETPGIGLAIFDNKKCYIRTAQSLGNSLFTNNSNIVNLSNYYFRSVWKTAKQTRLLT